MGSVITLPAPPSAGSCRPLPRRLSGSWSKTMLPSPAERHEALAARPADQGQPGFPRQLDAPFGEARARDQNGMRICAVLITISEVRRPVV